MRLIDADELINKLNKFESDVHGSAECYSSVTEITEAIEYVGILIDDTPTVEAVPVVRCKDCKHSDLPAVLTRKYGKTGTLTCHNRYGSCNNRNVNENDFCSAGELPEQI